MVFLTLITLGRPGGDWHDIVGVFEEADNAKTVAELFSEDSLRWEKMKLSDGIYDYAIAFVGLQRVRWSVFAAELNVIRPSMSAFIDQIRDDALLVGSKRVQ